MPRFRSPDSMIVRLTLPHPTAVGIYCLLLQPSSIYREFLNIDIKYELFLKLLYLYIYCADSKKIEEIRINPKEDVKFSLTFEESKLLLPMLVSLKFLLYCTAVHIILNIVQRNKMYEQVLFDAKRRVSLKKLVLTFYYDEYDLLRVSHEATCKKF